MGPWGRIESCPAIRMTKSPHYASLVAWQRADDLFIRLHRLASKTFEDYMLEGVVAAVGATLRITGQPHTNTLGYCVGGTLLACTLA